MFTVERIDHVVINVRDVEQSAQWYASVLGMRKEVVDGRMVLWFGDHKLHLRPMTASQDEWIAAVNTSAGSADLCFTTGTSVNQIVSQVTSQGIHVEEGPILRAGARGDMMSVYCRDPDGSLIEISTYAPNGISAET